MKERLEALDTFFEGLGLGEAEDAAPRSPRELLDELVGTVHVTVRLSPEEQRLLRDDPDQVRQAVRTQVENAVTGQSVMRLVGAIERRLEDSLELEAPSWPAADWEAMADQVYQAVQLGANQAPRALDGQWRWTCFRSAGTRPGSTLAKISGPVTTNHMLGLLLMMPQGYTCHI